MQIVCEQCHAEYEIDPPAGPFARDQNLVFRCTACGNSIPTRIAEPNRGAPTKAEPVATSPDADITEASQVPEENRILLRQQGKVYQVRGEAMLQRWIAERRIWRSDEVSLDGTNWTKAEKVDGCAIFFDLVDQADQTETATNTARKNLFAKPETTEDPLSAMGVSAPDTTEERPSTPHPEETIAQPPADPEPDEEVSVVEAKMEPDEPIRLAVEAIPEELPSTLPRFDDPTLDLEELADDGFFDGEQDSPMLSDPMGADSGVYDDELEWMQTKRKSMVTWWLLFFGALGGVGFFALDFLNKQDSKKSVNAATEVPSTEAADTPSPSGPVPDTEVESATQEDAAKAAAEPTDDGAAAEQAESTDEAPTDATASEAPASNEEGGSVAVDPVPPPPAPPSPAPTARPSQGSPPAPARVSPAREIDRGWAKIDREDWSAARTHFGNALAASPGNGDAQFGLAYVNENQGRLDEAVRQYCRLQQSGSGEAKAEAAGRLRALGRPCP